MQGAETLTVRFDLAKLLAGEHPQARHAVRDSALVQLFQPRNFLRAGRNYQFAALLEGNAVLLAEGFHGRRAGHAIARLQRACLVVQAGVDHAAVVSGLMGGDVVFLLDHEDAQFRKAAGDLERRRQSHNASANNQEVSFAISHEIRGLEANTRLYGQRATPAMTPVTRLRSALPGR